MHNNEYAYLISYKKNVDLSPNVWRLSIQGMNLRIFYITFPVRNEPLSQ